MVELRGRVDVLDLGVFLHGRFKGLIDDVYDGLGRLLAGRADFFLQVEQPAGRAKRAFFGIIMGDEEAKGKIEKTKGKIREEVGKMTGNRSEQIKGKAEQVKGKLQEEAGKAKRKSYE